MADNPSQQTPQQSQQDGGGSQSGDQTPPPQTPPAQQTPPDSQQVETLPKELADLGFRSVKDVLGYMAEAGEDARKAKTMYKELTSQISGRVQQEEEVTDDHFIQSPKAATEKVFKRMQSQFEERITPFMSQMVEGNVAMQKMLLKNDPVYGAVLPELEDELDSYLRTIPPDLKVRNNAVKVALEQLIGRNFPKVAKKYNEAIARVNAGSEGGSNSSGGQTGVTKKASLSDEERTSVERQIRAGVFKDIDEYIKWRDS